MITKRITLHAKNTDNGSVIRKFIEGLYSHPIYASVIEQLKSTDGFVKKVNNLTEDRVSTTFISEVVFTNQETLDNYFNEPSIKNLYDYILSMAESENIEILIEIKEL